MRLPIISVLVRCLCFAMFATVAACTVPDESAVSASTEARETNLTASQPREAVALESDGSLAALTAEVRQLRLTIEELIRGQAETQALSARLSVHQGRIEQVTGRLDTARSEIDILNAQSQDYESRLASLSAELAAAADQEARGRLENVISRTRNEQALISSVLQQARNRESELSRALQLEEAQWNDLVAGIDQLTR